MSTLGLVDAQGSSAVQGAIFALKLANRDLRLEVYADARRDLGQEWTAGLAEHAKTSLENRVLVQGSKVRVGTQGFTVTAAKSVKKLPGGLIPARDYAAVEWGAATHKSVVVTHSSKGTAYSVKKVTTNQLRRRNRRGYVVMPTAHALGERLVAFWVQDVVRIMRDAMNGGSRG